MRNEKILSYLVIATVFLSVTTVGFCSQVHKDKLEKAESRLRGIYDTKEFSAKSFRAEWLDDSTGFTVMEKADGSDKKVKVCYGLDGKKRSLPDSNSKDGRGKSKEISPDGKLKVYSEKGNLFVRESGSKKSVPLTMIKEGISVSNGQASWSPDSKLIAFVQSDKSKIKERNVFVPVDPSYPEVKKTRFARIGETIPGLRVGVVDAEGKEIRWLAIPEPAEGYYLGQVSWAGNSHEVFVEKLSRFRDEREFLLADIRTGKITRIFHETDPAWVVASYHKNLGIDWINGGKAFIVVTEKDGWRHAYVYSRAGKELALLTPGKFDIIEKSIVDEASGWYYYYASPDNGTQKYLYRVKLDGSAKPERVSPASQPGSHGYDFSPDRKWALHTYSSFDNPPITELVRMSDHRIVRVFEDNSELRENMKSFGSMSTEFLTLTIDGGIEMDALMVKPADFDPSKKYPVFIYVYGEPHLQTVLDKWSSSMPMFHRVISEMGYLVVSIDNRGTPAPKGAAWRRCIFGSLGPLSTEEQAAGIKELGRTRPYVDLSRVGIWGWSGGGSNTLNALFRKPDVYHLGIAVVPKPQPHLYNAWFQEIFMETPATNPEGYKKSAPINFAEGLKGDLLIITGTGETNTHIQIIEGLVDRLVELGKQFDYMVYPNRDHGMREGVGTSVHLRLLISRYLVDHLEPGPK